MVITYINMSSCPCVSDGHALDGTTLLIMITQLHINHLRNLNHVNLPLTQCNLIIGANGSGKTSILEALFLLSRGKSFRSHQPKLYITHKHSHCTVFARLQDDSRLGIEKHSDASTTLKLNGQILTAQSQLTARLPTTLIDPASMDILEQGSNLRRQLLDWLAFHVKPDFYPQWLAYQRLLKQRNSLLKQSRHLNDLNRQQLQAWDNMLAEHASCIHHYRQQVFGTWQHSFNHVLALLLPQYSYQIELNYQAGFDPNIPLQQTLHDRLQSDLKLGYTRVGSHRADIQVLWRGSQTDVAAQDAFYQDGFDEYGQIDDGEQTGDGGQTDVSRQRMRHKMLATNVLSRGEKKLLITALKLSQLPLLPVNHSSYGLISGSGGQLTSRPIVLLDDIDAELDANAMQVLLSTLATVPCQLFITSLSKDILPMIESHWQELSVFHVKHGKVDGVV